LKAATTSTSFALLLGIAQIPPEQMQAAIWVVSDMGRSTLREKYYRAGYPMPMLVFWNVASHELKTPALAAQEGVALVKLQRLCWRTRLSPRTRLCCGRCCYVLALTALADVVE